MDFSTSDKIKNRLPQNSLLQSIIIALLVVVVVSINGQAQVLYGNYSTDYENSQTIVVNASALSTCQVKQIWATTTPQSNLLLSSHNGNKLARITGSVFVNN